MTTDTYINENKTATFKKGDTVVMHSCGEANFPKYKGKIWTCQTDSYLDRGKQEVVFLEGFSGCFSAKRFAANRSWRLRSRNVDIITKPPILVRCCYAFVLFDSVNNLKTKI